MLVDLLTGRVAVVVAPPPGGALVNLERPQRTRVRLSITVGEVIFP